MSPVNFKKRPCRPVEFKGQGPQEEVYRIRLPMYPHLASMNDSLKNAIYVYTVELYMNLKESNFSAIFCVNHNIDVPLPFNLFI